MMVLRTSNKREKKLKALNHHVFKKVKRNLKKISKKGAKNVTSNLEEQRLAPFRHKF